MVKVTPFLNSQIIQKYLYGFSLSQISNETGISKTTAHNIVYDWKLRISDTDIEELRTLLSEIRTSGITIVECVQGFRIAQILKNFNINDDFEEWNDEEKEIENQRDAEIHDLKTSLANESLSTDDFKSSNSNKELIDKRSVEIKNNNKSNQIVYFINTIYRNCKHHGIKPSIIIKWIEDLFEFYSISVDNQLKDKNNIYIHSNKITIQDLDDDINHDKVQMNDFDEKLNNEIPLVSKVSYFIEQKTKRIKLLQEIENSISTNINKLTEQRKDVISDLNKAIEKENQVFSYFKWYDNLRQELFFKYNLIIEQEYEKFVNTINDFKQYNFDVTKILSEYKHIDSLRKEDERVQIQVDQDISRRENLIKEISSLEEQSSYYRQTINLYQQLHKEGFGLKELKQLNLLIMESALANNFDVKSSIKKFLKDIEDQYDNKLGFESKINELKIQMENLKEQVPEYKNKLRLEGIVGPTLIHLNSNGVSNEDIIGMNKLVIDFRNTNFLSDPFVNKEQNTNTIVTSTNTLNKGQYWTTFIEKLKSLKNINLEISNQSTSLNNLKTQISNLKIKKQQTEKTYLESANNLNHIIHQTLNLIQFIKQTISDINKRMIITPIFSPVFINIVVAKSNDEDNEKNSK